MMMASPQDRSAASPSNTISHRLPLSPAGGRPGAGRRQSSGQRGFALVVVIVVVLLASFLASQLIMEVRGELMVSHNIKARVEGHFLAQAGVNIALFRLLDRPMEAPALGPKEDWDYFSEAYEYQVFLPGGQASYYVTNESGKIDLNKAPIPLLQLFFQYELGEDNEDAINKVMDSLQDWRDQDDMPRLNGAESEYYGALPDPYIARNGDIQDPAEFFLIRGTKPMIGKFTAQDIFTVHNPDGKINFNSLTPAMLDFLTGGDKEKAAEYRQAKVDYQGHIGPDVASQILGDRFVLFQPYLVYAVANNPYFYIVGTGVAGAEQPADPAQGADAGGTNPRKKAPGTVDSMIIKKEGGSFSCLAWQESFS